MEEMEINLPTLKTVKKTTYNAIVTKAHLNINPENISIKRVRSHSFKMNKNFVPKLRPKKSTLVPEPLKLNKVKKTFLNKEKDNIDKQMSGDEIELNEDSSLSSISSSDMNSSDDDSEKSSQKQNKMKDKKRDRNTSCNIYEKFDSNEDDSDDDDDYDFYLNEIKDNNKHGEKNNLELNKNIKVYRRKMTQIRVRAGKNKFRETEEVIHDNLKKAFNIGLKKYEIEDEFPCHFHASVNFFESKDNIKPKSRTIFEVISLSKICEK